MTTSRVILLVLYLLRQAERSQASKFTSLDEFESWQLGAYDASLRTDTFSDTFPIDAALSRSRETYVLPSHRETTETFKLEQLLSGTPVVYLDPRTRGSQLRGVLLLARVLSIERIDSRRRLIRYRLSCSRVNFATRCVDRRDGNLST